MWEFMIVKIKMLLQSLIKFLPVFVQNDTITATGSPSLETISSLTGLTQKEIIIIVEKAADS